MRLKIGANAIWPTRKIIEKIQNVRPNALPPEVTSSVLHACVSVNFGHFGLHDNTIDVSHVIELYPEPLTRYDVRYKRRESTAVLLFSIL